MRVRLHELDSRLSRAITTRRWQPWRQVAARMGAWTTLLLAVFMGMGPHPVQPSGELLVWFGLVAWVFTYYGRQLRRLLPTAPLALSKEELRAAFWEIVPSPAERAYVETLQRLSDAAPALGEPAARDLLPRLRELLASARHLDRQRERVRAAFGTETVADLEVKCADLARRHDAASDPVVRQALHQSRELCRERLQGVRVLEVGLSRIEAQQELVNQTFASVQATLARARVAPAGLGSPDLAATFASLAEISRQTRAVEQAAEEVAE